MRLGMPALPSVGGVSWRSRRGLRLNCFERGGHDTCLNPKSWVVPDLRDGCQTVSLLQRGPQGVDREVPCDVGALGVSQTVQQKEVMDHARYPH